MKTPTRMKWFFKNTSLEQIRELSQLKFDRVLDEYCPEEKYHHYFIVDYSKIPQWMKDHSSFVFE